MSRWMLTSKVTRFSNNDMRNHASPTMQISQYRMIRLNFDSRFRCTTDSDLHRPDRQNRKANEFHEGILKAGATIDPHRLL